MWHVASPPSRWLPPLTHAMAPLMNPNKPRNIQSVRKEVSKAKQAEPIGPFKVSLRDLRRDPLFQVRKGLVPENVKRLRIAYESGNNVPPILIGFIEGEELPFVLDGHHRYTALEDVGGEVIEAVAVVSSKREAQWTAAGANLTHGQPYSPRELRPVFRRFISARKHVLPDGASKSYAQIGAEIGVKKATVYKWMRKDYPDIARKMGREDLPSGPRERPPLPKPVIDRLGDFRAHLQALRDDFELAHPDEQFEALRMIETAMAHFREVHEVSVEEHNPFREPAGKPF